MGIDDFSTAAVNCGASGFFLVVPNYVAALRLLHLLLKMKHVSYKEYVITVANTNENRTWRPHVTITWDAGKFNLHDELCFTTEIEAEEHGVELGKHWVNNRIQSMQPLPSNEH